MTTEKSEILKVLNKAEVLFVADYNDEYGVSSNMIQKLFQYGEYDKPLNLGLIVLEEVEPNGYIVVEGVQKLLTLSLILFALCECYKRTNASNEAAISKIYEKYLLGKIGTKFQLSGENKEIYEKIIYKEKLEFEEKQNPLFVVLHDFWEEIREKEISANALFQLLKSVEGYVVKIKKGEGLDFYYALNKNSVMLDSAKLIRSYLSHNVPGMVKTWDETLQEYIDYNIYGVFEQFLKDFLSIQNTKIPVPITEVYPFFVAYFEEATKSRNPENVLLNIREFSERYLRMMRVDFEYFDIKKHFIRLNENGGQVAYPYLLEVLTDYDNGRITTDMLNVTLKTIYDFVRTGQTFDFTKLSEKINAILVERRLI